MTKSIPLTQGQVAFVDDEDFDWLIKSKWYAKKIPSNGKFYAYNAKNTSMARVVMKTPPGLDTDHISGNTLDNRRCNLRICTKQQNQINRGKQKNNTSGYKGVFYVCKKWAAVIQVSRKKVYLGRYETPEEASKVYNDAANKYFGDFAKKINKE